MWFLIGFLIGLFLGAPLGIIIIAILNVDKCENCKYILRKKAAEMIKDTTERLEKLGDNK